VGRYLDTEWKSIWKEKGQKAINKRLDEEVKVKETYQVGGPIIKEGPNGPDRDPPLWLLNPLREPSVGQREHNRIRIQKEGSNGREVLIGPDLHKETTLVC